MEKMEGAWRLGTIADGINTLMAICAKAASRGLMSGWSGNASLRAGADLALITAAGSAKGALQAKDFLLMRLNGDILGGAGRPSSESAMHLGLYSRTECAAILHTHPPYLQTLDLKLAGRPGGLDPAEFLDVDLYEAKMWRPRLDFVGGFAPGSLELANAVAATAGGAKCLPHAIWLRGHGLCAIGAALLDCLCLIEELEHLARIQLGLI